MKYVLTLLIFISFHYIASAQSTQIGYYSGESVFRNEGVTSASSIGQSRTMWSNNVNIKWLPRAKFNLEAGFGYYLPRIGTFTGNFLNESNYILYTAYMKDDIQDHEYYLTAYDKIFQPRHFVVNIGGSATYFPEKDTRYEKIYETQDPAKFYTLNMWTKVNLLYFGINTDISYKINRQLSINIRASYKFELYNIRFKQQAYLLYDRVPDAYRSFQLGINYRFRIRRIN